MADNTGIEYCDATWNPIAGCSQISPGCDNCYAERMAWRLANNPKASIGWRAVVDGGRWTGKMNLFADALEKPLSWKKPRRVFVCSMGDLFHEAVPDAWITQIFHLMHEARQHTYLLLTKRAERMSVFIENYARDNAWGAGYPHVWCGVTIENQPALDYRLPYLLRTPAAVRFVSCEPLLGPLEFSDVTHRSDCVSRLGKPAFEGIDWVIAGGETGPGARPMHPDWARGLRDQCNAAGVPFFFKQWGEWEPTPRTGAPDGLQVNLNGQTDTAAQLLFYGLAFTDGWTHETGCRHCARVGKRAAGRLLDGRDWNEMPEVRHA